MADFYVWTKAELGLDVPDMDSEHQVLIDKMNALYRGVENKAAFAELEKLLMDLANYTSKHFADEEAYMQKIGFAGIETHKILHKKLLEKFGEHVAEFKKTKALNQDFFTFLKFWLTSHIKGVDMKYSQAAKSGKAA